MPLKGSKSNTKVGRFESMPSYLKNPKIHLTSKSVPYIVVFIYKLLIENT